MNLTKKRWLILTACCFINLCIGSLYAWSVLAGPMAEYLGTRLGLELTARDLAIVFTLANSVGPITMIAGGKINDTFGPKVVIFIGGLMFGGGMFLSGFATSVGMLIASYSILLGLGLGMVYGATISTCIKFFPDKRGLVGGLTTATFGISSVIMPPVATFLMTQNGPNTTFKIIGIVFTVIICLSALLISPCPQDFVPDGYQPPASANGSSNVVNKNWKEMLCTPSFYVMLFMLTGGAFAAMMFIPMASPIAQNMINMTPVAATAAVSVLALFNVCGRVLAGSISDRIGRINTLALACVLSIGGLSCLYFAKEGDVALFYIGISIVGICFGSFMGVFPGFTADQFGPKNNSVNYGIMFIGFAVAGYAGPSILNHIFAKNGSYNQAFIFAMLFSAAGLLLSFVYRALKKTENA